MSLIFLIVGCTLVSFLLTAVLRYYAVNKNLIDIPNKRSSHTHPTPRGGGLAVVTTFLLFLLLCPVYNLLSWNSTLSFFIAGLIIAIVGFLDDLGHIKAGIRLIFHFISTSLIVYAVKGLPIIDFFGFNIDFQLWGWGLAILASVWILNLFNFMDGIDGIAAIEAVTTTAIMGLLSLFVFDDLDNALVHFALTFSSLGFLIWNFPPAKIFMGDAGSGFIGLMLAGLLLLSSHISNELFWCWLVILGVFIVDATITLIQRALRGKKVYEAHRNHAYQYASRKYNSHLQVTVFVACINIFWLAPMAYLIASKLILGGVGLIIAYTPLIVLAIRFKAGAQESDI